MAFLLTLNFIQKPRESDQNVHKKKISLKVKKFKRQVSKRPEDKNALDSPQV